MKLHAIVLGLSALAGAILAQSDRGTITGTVTDPAGAVVAGAQIEIKNVATGAVYQAGTSATGNYTLAQLPAGQYELTVTVPGFKKFVQKSVTVDVANTYRVDAVLEVGSAAESVTVTEAAPLLKTESGELSHNVTTDTMNNLPVLAIGSAAGASGIRNPYAVVQLLPGSSYSPDGLGADLGIRINGMPANTMAMRIEGMDATNGWYSTQSQTQPSVDAIQEVAVQTSNYSAELGLAGGGLFNLTMKSGTNALHGSAYLYFVNEALNAGTPFTTNGNGGLLRPRQRREDYGFTLGGPIYLPKLYNGHDKAFFFFNFEQFRQTIITNNVEYTVPTLAYRTGNFAQALTGRNLGTDGLGRPIMENTIYDPSTDFVVNGLTYRNPFPGNIIPPADLDPVALNIENLLPQPNGPNANGLINNYLPTYRNPSATTIPSVKIDYLVSPKSKITGYWSLTDRNTPNNSALPQPLEGTPDHIPTNTIRLNFDQTLTPTLLLHFGAGLLDMHFFQTADSINPAQELGLTGSNSPYFPVLETLSGAAGAGGLSITTGPGVVEHLVYYKPNGNTNLTWVKNNHTYKFGGEVMTDGYKIYNITYSMGWLAFSPNETGLPALNGVSLASTVGFNYASFMLGAVDSGIDGTPAATRMGAHALSGYAQDSWKVTRRLTIDYGLRYDFSSYLRDGHGYYIIFSPSTPNENAGGRPGGLIGEGYGGGRCNCEFAHNYPFAFGPRLGLAYQITSKTVLRVGSGISYFKTDDNNFGYSAGSEFGYTNTAYGYPAYLMRNGLPYKVTFPNFDPGQYLYPGETGSVTQAMDQNAGRPARQIQWSLGIQREIVRNLLVEATYVGNRGAYWNGAGLICTNCTTPATLASYGMNLNSAADRSILASQLGSTTAIQGGFANFYPYPTFPLQATVAQALRPFPQYTSITNWHWVPDGDTWYESLQMKATKRFSHGLEFGSNFTWAKQLDVGVEDDYGRGDGVQINDAFNRRNQKDLSVFDQPFQFVFSGGYTTPKLPGGNKFTGNKVVSWIAKDWQIGTLLRYASGFPIPSPTSTNSLSTYLFQSTLFNRVPGVPLFTHDLNCHCFDPNKTFVLNPAAWSNPAAGQWGTAAGYYSDFRYQRRPVENMSLGRNFRIKERANLQIRAEFTNVFNRTEMNNPTATNPLATQTVTSTGQTTSGFGYISNATTFSAPRQGQLIARFQF
ncbi:MAG TPA: carboxypeptidase-like regulatory domain-containing protein [Bryobacteraceae bacterium]